ncbi:hypothetical protein [Azotobacter salinestris]|uniref:hypothetical protein n=1 Tax=Azotobacter salinestris TaxID=69964 RepID=UPI001266C5D7|nr:hypothetical protein [Azotobacter salinestris]
MSDLICRKTMMRLLVVLAALLLAACKIEPTPPAGAPTEVHGDWLKTWHDDEHRVTCWLHSVNGGKSLSCLPDWMLTAKEARHGE